MVREYYVRSIVIDPVDAGAYASYACFDDLPFTDYPAARNAIKKYFLFIPRPMLLDFTTVYPFDFENLLKPKKITSQP